MPGGVREIYVLLFARETGDSIALVESPFPV